ncbi:MAG: hypothetical protein ACRDZW_07780 [Acidimicrobiales bacterium]
MTDGLLDEVGRAMAEVAADIIQPRFGRLVEGDISEKAAGEVVTVADREAEVALGRRLR